MCERKSSTPFAIRLQVFEGLFTLEWVWGVLGCLGVFCGNEQTEEAEIRKTEFREQARLSALCTVPLQMKERALGLAGIAVLVRVPNSRPKGCEFQSRQERRESFLQAMNELLTIVQKSSHASKKPTAAAEFSFMLWLFSTGGTIISASVIPPHVVQKPMEC